MKFSTVQTLIQRTRFPAPACDVQTLLAHSLVHEGKFYTLREIAVRLGLPPRTLSRSLNHCDVSVTQLKHEIRRAYVVSVMSFNTSISYEMLAFECGFLARGAVVDFVMREFQLTPPELHDLVRGKKIPFLYEQVHSTAHIEKRLLAAQAVVTEARKDLKHLKASRQILAKARGVIKEFDILLAALKNE